jgi:predicted membrane protein
MTLDVPGAPRPEQPRVTVQAVFGLLIIAVGVLFTLDNLDILDARDYLRYWPIGLVAIGSLKMYQASRGNRGWLSGAIFAGLGVWMLIERIVYVTIDARDVFPLALVTLGGYLVWRGFSGHGDTARAADGRADFSALAIMGGVVRKSNAQNFRGADLTAVMGGCEIDLRQASIAPGGEAVIEVFAFWGGIELKVPEDWTVVSRVVPIMGGVEDKTHAPQTADKRLVIRGLLVMGGCSVKNRSREDE